MNITFQQRIQGMRDAGEIRTEAPLMAETAQSAAQLILVDRLGQMH